MTKYWHIRGIGVLVAALLAAATGATTILQDPAELLAFAESSCRQAAERHGYPEVDVTVHPPSDGMRLPRCDRQLEAIPTMSGGILGDVSLGVRCNGEPAWTVYLRARVEAQQLIPVLARPLAARSQIAAGDLKLVAVSSGFALNGVMLEPEHIIGKELIRSLEADSPVKVSQVRLPKLVKRGQYVTLLSGGNGLEVRMQGKALGEAAAGDHLRATNLSSGHIVEGVVNSDGTLSVR